MSNFLELMESNQMTPEESSPEGDEWFSPPKSTHIDPQPEKNDTAGCAINKVWANKSLGRKGVY